MRSGKTGNIFLEGGIREREQQRQSTVMPSGKNSQAVSNISTAGRPWNAWSLGKQDMQADLIGKEAVDLP
jgi:hypothetical protein